MKYPITLHAYVLFIAWLTLVLSGNSTLFAQSAEVIHNSPIVDTPENSRAAPSVIFRIESTLTNPSDYFEYLDMNFTPPVSVEQVSPGEFHIFNLQPFRSYKFDFKGNGPVLLEVTISDVAKIARHLLGLRTLDPVSIIAADVTCDGRLSAADLVDIRRLILDKTTMFTCGVSWKFIPATADFYYDGTTVDLGTVRAIKIGNVK